MKIVLQDYEDVEIEMDNEIYYLKKANRDGLIVAFSLDSLLL